MLSQGLHGSLVSVPQNKTPVKVWIFHPLAQWKEIQQFLGEGEIGKHDSVYPNFSWPFRVRKRKFFVKVFRSTNLPFPKIKPRKFKFLTVTPAPVRKKFTNFGEEKLETTIWFLPKLFIVLYYHKTKLLRQFLVQAIYIWENTNQRNLKIPPSCLL